MEKNTLLKNADGWLKNAPELFLLGEARREKQKARSWGLMFSCYRSKNDSAIPSHHINQEACHHSSHIRKPREGTDSCHHLVKQLHPLPSS